MAVVETSLGLVHDGTEGGSLSAQREGVWPTTSLDFTKFQIQSNRLSQVKLLTSWLA